MWGEQLLLSVCVGGRGLCVRQPKVRFEADSAIVVSVRGNDVMAISS